MGQIEIYHSNLINNDPNQDDQEGQENPPYVFLKETGVLMGSLNRYNQSAQLIFEKYHSSGIATVTHEVNKK